MDFNPTSPGGTTTTTIGTERQQSGYTLQQVADQECAVHTTRPDQLASTATNNDVGVHHPGGDLNPISRTVYNRAPAPQAVITLHKTWVINGQTFNDGAQPSPFFAQATLTGPGAAGASNQGWGITRGGYSVGNTAVVERIDQRSPAPPSARSRAGGLLWWTHDT